MFSSNFNFLSLVVSAVVSAMTFFSAPVFATGNVSGTFSNEAGSRSYTAFIPEKLSERPGLLVILHGCFLTGQQMATGTDMNRIATEKGFAVLYPEQTYQNNQWKCWNWFKPENQRREGGELSILAGMTQEIVKKYGLDASRVFATGLSAGSAMAANLLGCYSDVFAGGLLHSGLEFAAAQTEQEAHRVTTSGPNRNLDGSAKQALECSPKRDRLMPIIVVHGQKDPFVKIINGDRTALFFEKLNNLLFANTGGQSGDVTRVESRITQSGFKYSAAVNDTLYKGQLVVRKLTVEGMGHGWSGGKATAPYMEPRGIDVSRILVDTFFN